MTSLFFRSNSKHKLKSSTLTSLPSTSSEKSSVSSDNMKSSTSSSKQILSKVSQMLFRLSIQSTDKPSTTRSSIGPDSATFVDPKAFSVETRSKSTSTQRRGIKSNVLQSTASQNIEGRSPSIQRKQYRETEPDNEYQDNYRTYGTVVYDSKGRRMNTDGSNTNTTNRVSLTSSSSSSSSSYSSSAASSARPSVVIPKRQGTQFSSYSDITLQSQPTNKLATSTTVTSSSTIPVTSNITSKGKDGGLCCDKCDGKHATDDCPYYKKPREAHPDAQRGKKIGGMSSLPGNLIRNARVVRQPGDGSCLFHSMSYGLKNGLSADRLRNEICQYIRHNPSLKISDTPLSDWVKWDSNLSCSEYARRMSCGTWGGGIEMACTSLMYRCNVHVYERCSEGYKRISAFDYPENPANLPVVRVLYCGGVHYGK